MRLSTLVLICVFLPFAWPSASAEIAEMIVTNSIKLPPGTHSLRLRVRSSHLTIEGAETTLQGTGKTNDAASLEGAGVGVLIEGATDIVLKGLKVTGFATGLVARDATAISISGCDFSDNYHNPSHGWGELPPRGGILFERVRLSVIDGSRANRVWNGLRLIDSEENLIEDCDFSYCSNTAVSLWHSSRNQFLRNNLSYGIRIDRAAGEVHARDSTGVLIETGSNDNYWFRNDVTYGGDGIFIRPLNRWVSRGNIFVENDTSYANNNCVESWSPGNTFIRNKANHGSYGFWLGGSDQTVLIGNEAAYNGLTNGNHNAPEPGFRHGGIVIVAGSSSHTLIEGNNIHDNNGGGIVFRGDVGSKGEKWRTEHWVIQRNRIANNRIGIWGRYANAITLAANSFTNNLQDLALTNVVNLVQLAGAANGPAPIAQITGPSVATVGEAIRFDAALSRDPAGEPLNFHWWLNGEAGRGAFLQKTFTEPGFYRLGLTVDNGTLAALAWRDLLVVTPIAQEIGTEGQASAWGYELENNSGSGRIRFADDPQAVIGRTCLRFTPNPYPGAYATAIYPATRDGKWDLTEKKFVSFWIRVENPNLPGFQNAGPVVRLLSAKGQLELKPVKEENILNDPPFSEARWLWMPVRIPLNGNHQWARTEKGEFDEGKVNAVSVSLDSWGGDAFTVWLDGLAWE